MAQALGDNGNLAPARRIQIDFHVRCQMLKVNADIGHLIRNHLFGNGIAAPMLLKQVGQFASLAAKGQHQEITNLAVGFKAATGLDPAHIFAVIFQAVAVPFGFLILLMIYLPCCALPHHAAIAGVSHNSCPYTMTGIPMR